MDLSGELAGLADPLPAAADSPPARQTDSPPSGSVAQPPTRLVVLVSGTGSNLQTILQASTDAAYGAQVVAVGADRPGAPALERAQRAGLPTFVVRLADFTNRASWDAALTMQVQAYRPDLVVCAGFMKVLGQSFVQTYAGRILNSHPALLPAFPGAHAVQDALDYGVRVTGVSVHYVDAGVDTGPILAQQAVEVRPGDDAATLHARIKEVERPLFSAVVGQVARQVRRCQLQEGVDGTS